ncbi:S-adenosyl-L-methionine-dependent methyltransferase [Pelagophyceae sp. CCMP2097]|nr:S-adenosyl-L-methionine-dependent methyltransferase [Pelagophyceae sp. CCMP2097]
MLRQSRACRSKLPRGGAAFDAYHGEAYGERWPLLKASLLKPQRRLQRLNLFSSTQPIMYKAWPQAASVCYAEEGDAGNQDLRPKPFYSMDAASVLAAEALGCQPSDDVLDMCAAPGGKTLILAEALASGRGELTANDLSSERGHRLRRVVQEHVGAEMADRVLFAKVDGQKWGQTHAQRFDRVLLDAPCSGERYLLEHDEELRMWTTGRSRNLRLRQFSLLSSAFLALKVGGRLVYSTCSINSKENDGVIDKLLRRRRGSVEVVKYEPPATTNVRDDERIDEPTDHGRATLPDRAQGFGPGYFAVLQRTAI